MKFVTLDTNVLPATDLIEAAKGRPFGFARVSVTDREVVDAPPHVHLEGTDQVLETAVWGESRFGDAVWGSDHSPLEEILFIISSGSFPSDRSKLSEGQRRQLRDAMIFEAHVRDHRDILVSDDTRAFMQHGKRERLESRFDTRILTRNEFKRFLE